MKTNLSLQHPIEGGRKALLYFLPPLIVAAVLLVVFFLKGIYPFGNLTVVYGDMDQHYIPQSYHIYDVFHNGASLLWDSLLGTGSNIFGAEALSGMFSPISWLVIFTSRENIPHFASFLLLIRMALLSLTSFIFINKLFRDTLAFWRVVISVMAAFSGYVLIFYTNMPWIDCAILFPLLLLALKDLYDKDKIIGYVCILSANLIISFYISFMVLLFLFFSCGVFLHFYIEKNRRKKVLVNLGIGTISALLLTSFVTIPGFLQSASSIRFGGFSYIDVIGTDANSSVTLNKAVFFFFSAVTLVVFIKILANYKNNKKMVTIFGLLMGLTGLQVIVEATNKLWYGGSYVCYPLRFGYIPLFLLLAGTAWYFSPGFIKKRRVKAIMSGEISTADSKKQFLNRLLNIVFGATALAAYIIAVYLGSTFGGAINKTLYGYWGIAENSCWLFMLTAILFGVAIWILLRLRESKIKYALIAMVLLTEIFTHSIWYIGVSPRLESHIDDWSIVANELHDDLTINNGTISRYKDADSVMNANYPLIAGTQAVTSYLHLIEARQQKSFELLGYSTNYTRILDTGGTLFSDMALNVNHFLTSKPYSTDVFDLIGKSGELYIYRNKYVLPAGIVFSAGSDGQKISDSLDFNGNTSPLNNQNFMYQTLFNRTDDIINLVQSDPQLTNIKTNHSGEQLSCELEDSRKAGSITYEFTVTGANYIYFGAANISNPIHIKVNGQPVSAPTFGNINNSIFPTSYNNRILNLGLFNNENVKVEINTNMNVSFQSLAIGMLSVEKLKALSTQAISSNRTDTTINKNEIMVNTFAEQEGQFLFLPINFDQGWKCTINGKPVEVTRIFGTFIRLDLAAGENIIRLQFIPRGLETGGWLSGITLLIWIVAFLVTRRKKRMDLIPERTMTVLPEGIKKKTQHFSNEMVSVIYIVFWIVYFSALLFFYIVPALSFILRHLLPNVFK